MGRRKKGALPDYKKHKASGRAYVHINGKPLYLGKHGTPESKKKYRQLLKKLEREERERQGKAPVVAEAGCTIHALLAAWSSANLARLSDDEQRAYRVILRDMARGWGDLPADDFGPKELKALRQAWIDKKQRRQTVNKKVGRTRRIFRWGVGDGCVEAATLVGLEAVPDLLEGDHDLEDYEEVDPVPLRDLVRTLRVSPPDLATMLRVGYYVGCRSGELCRMVPEEIHRDGIARIGNRLVRVGADCWVFQPGQHKTKKKSKRTRYLAYVIGPRARKLLEPVLERTESGCPLWRPDRSEVYNSASLAKRIEKLCEKHGIPAWSPGRLRHNFASRVDARFGLLDTSAALGHTSPAITAAYIQKNLDRAAEVAARLG